MQVHEPPRVAVRFPRAAAAGAAFVTVDPTLPARILLARAAPCAVETRYEE
jgi:hypothetical protein